MKKEVIGLKDLRENMESYIKEVAKGKSFLVVRRSNPVFRLTPVSENRDKEVAQISLGIINRYRKALKRLADA